MYCGEKFFWSVALLGTGGGIEWENVRNRTDFSVKKFFCGILSMEGMTAPTCFRKEENSGT